MKILLYVPIVLSLAVLGAHCMRYGNRIGLVVALLSALLFETRMMKSIYRLGG